MSLNGKTSGFVCHIYFDGRIQLTAPTESKLRQKIDALAEHMARVYGRKASELKQIFHIRKHSLSEHEHKKKRMSSLIHMLAQAYGLNAPELKDAYQMIIEKHYHGGCISPIVSFANCVVQLAQAGNGRCNLRLRRKDKVTKLEKFIIRHSDNSNGRLTKIWEEDNIRGLYTFL